MTEQGTPRDISRRTLFGLNRPTSLAGENVHEAQSRGIQFPPKDVTRRGFLGIAGVTGLEIALKSDENAVGNARGDLQRIDDFQPAQEYEISSGDYYGTKPVSFTQEQLLTDDNPRLKVGLGEHDIAFAVVHAGYVDYTLDDAQEYYKEDPEEAVQDPREVRYWTSIATGELGDYPTHLANITDVRDQVADTDAPVIFFVEYKDTQNETIPLADLTPPDNAFVVITENSDSQPIESFYTTGQDGTPQVTFQQPQLLFDALRGSNVTTIVMAGEFSFNDRDKLACLGGAAQQFIDNGFTIQGIEGAVFPTLRPGAVQEGETVRTGLYDHAVSIQELDRLVKEE